MRPNESLTELAKSRQPGSPRRSLRRHDHMCGRRRSRGGASPESWPLCNIRDVPAARREYFPSLGWTPEKCAHARHHKNKGVCYTTHQNHISRVWDIVEKTRVGMLTTRFAGGLRALFYFACPKSMGRHTCSAPEVAKFIASITAPVSPWATAFNGRHFLRPRPSGRAVQIAKITARPSLSHYTKVS